MREDVHDLLPEPGKRIASKRLREEIRQVVQGVHLGHGQRTIGLALTHNTLAPGDVARRFGGNEVVHESDHVRRVNVKDGRLVVLRQPDLTEVATRPHHIVRVGRRGDDLGVRRRGGGAVLLATIVACVDPPASCPVPPVVERRVLQSLSDQCT